MLLTNNILCQVTFLSVIKYSPNSVIQKIIGKSAFGVEYSLEHSKIIITLLVVTLMIEGEKEENIREV